MGRQNAAYIKENFLSAIQQGVEVCREVMTPRYEAYASLCLINLCQNYCTD